MNQKSTLTLNKLDQLSLQNILLRMQIEHNKKNILQNEIATTNQKLDQLKADLDKWNTQTQKDYNIDITKVMIDADSGEVTLVEG